jgi:pimeloyl-ACP methyl ester carboxylesterase
VGAEGMHADFSDPEAMATSTRMPTEQDMAAMKETYTRLSPHPEHFETFLATLSSSAEDLKGWSDEQLASVRVPVLFVIGDHDFTTVEHAGLMLEKTPDSQLLVLPGTTHMLATHRVDVLDSVLAAFLA